MLFRSRLLFIDSVFSFAAVENVLKFPTYNNNYNNTFYVNNTFCIAKTKTKTTYEMLQLKKLLFEKYMPILNLMPTTCFKKGETGQ